MKNIFEFADELGPLKVIHVYEPSVNLKAVLVVDNIAKGPSIGGVRMAADVSTEECMRLARAMTLKNSAAGLPYGGGKAVLYGDPKMPKIEKEKLIRALANALRNEETYVFAPDMGTDEECMAWVRDEIGRVVGLPRELGGIPLDEIGATGYGISHVVDVALNYCDFPLKGAKVVVQGFGAVGKHAARYLVEKGAVLVAVADSLGAISNPEGLDIEKLITLKSQGRGVTDYLDAKKMARDEVIDVPCDIWIPAARPDVIHEDNVNRLNTRLVVQGANIPFTHGAEKILHNKGVLCIPDFIANAGGVICAATEYEGGNQSTALANIKGKLRYNTEQMLEMVKHKQILPREAAMEMAVERLKKAMSFRRFSLFSCGPKFI
jgi:glutamate dehydrogenase (NAD(P)+)